LRVIQLILTLILTAILTTVGKDNYQLFGQDEALGLRMKINGATVMIPTIYNPSELRADVTGKIVRFLQQDGETVEKDKPYVEVLNLNPNSDYNPKS
jgi:acetyl-CoA carboxylase/biotin carboxylase 1